MTSRPCPLGHGHHGQTEQNQLFDFSSDLFSCWEYQSQDPRLNGDTTYQQLVKSCVWARNNQVTISGFTPLELAFGRRPPPLLDHSTSSPEELTTDPLREDKIDREVRKLAQGTSWSQAKWRSQTWSCKKNEAFRRSILTWKKSFRVGKGLHQT